MDDKVVNPDPAQNPPLEAASIAAATPKVFLTDATAFEQAPPLGFEDVPVFELGAGCFVRMTELTAESARQFGVRVSDGDDKDAMALWIIACAINPETEEPIFKDGDATRKMFRNMGASIVMRLGNAALKLNGFTKDEAEKTTKN